MGILLLLLGTSLAPDIAGRTPNPDYAAAGSSVETSETSRDHRHEGEDGHLPPSSHNVELVGKLGLTNVAGGISDVGAWGDFAYLGTFNPECAGRPGAQGTGVHVVDIRDPRRPTKVGFIPAHPNSFVGEAVQIFHAETPFFTGEILVHGNEPCDPARPHEGGVTLWDVTDPLAPVRLANGGDNPPPKSPNVDGISASHSAFGWWVPESGRAYVMLVDNQEPQDVDILDVTDPNNPVQVAETGLLDWPDAHQPLANGDAPMHHDMQVKRIGDRWLALVSYWDAGWVILDVTDPTDPVFVDDSDYPTPDTLTDFDVPEGNAHQAWWSADNHFIIGTDEDFSPTRTACNIGMGPNAQGAPCGEFDWTVPLSARSPGRLSGTTVWGGSGCVEDVDGNGLGDRGELPLHAVTGADIVVFGRGTCLLSEKVATGELAGYDALIIGNGHEGSASGLLPDAFACGAQGSPVLGEASGVCIGHRAVHRLFDTDPAFAGPDDMGDLPPIGTLGRAFSAEGGVFDGWGYVRLLDADTLEEIDAYAIPEALDPAFADGFGDLSVHEVQTDPRPGVNLAYFSYYSAGLRVAAFGEDGIEEVGHFIAPGGNNFWGIEPIQPRTGRGIAGGGGKDAAPLLLLSDRDSGLWILRYTG
jgi:hypothetical protein